MAPQGLLANLVCGRDGGEVPRCRPCATAMSTGSSTVGWWAVPPASIYTNATSPTCADLSLEDQKLPFRAAAVPNSTPTPARSAC